MQKAMRPGYAGKTKGEECSNMKLACGAACKWEKAGSLCRQDSSMQNGQSAKRLSARLIRSFGYEV